MEEPGHKQVLFGTVLGLLINRSHFFKARDLTYDLPLLDFAIAGLRDNEQYSSALSAGVSHVARLDCFVLHITAFKRCNIDRKSVV